MKLRQLQYVLEPKNANEKPITTLGGWVESENNFRGCPKILQGVEVWGNAFIDGDGVKIHGNNIKICGNTRIKDDVEISGGNLTIDGDVLLKDTVYINPSNSEKNIIKGNVKIIGDTRLFEHINIYGKIDIFSMYRLESVTLSGNISISGKVMLYKEIIETKYNTRVLLSGDNLCFDNGIIDAMKNDVVIEGSAIIKRYHKIRKGDEFIHIHNIIDGKNQSQSYTFYRTYDGEIILVDKKSNHWTLSDYERELTTKDKQITKTINLIKNLWK